MSTINLAISTCPNDTFAFHGIMEKKVDWRGLNFNIELLDISQLNHGLMAGQFDIAKASFHAALHLADRYSVLSAGAALGFGNGPLLLASHSGTSPSAKTQKTLCPGKWTTATLLFRLFYDQTGIDHVLFSDIMPALQQGTADFGVCIHEGRFTYREQGLSLVEDLGRRWEQETKSPLPLGGILASKALPLGTQKTVAEIVRDSIEYAMQNRHQTVATMNRYAQEFSEDVLFQHVDLYVNEWTIELGDVGRSALNKMQQMAKRLNISSTQRLEII